MGEILAFGKKNREVKLFSIPIQYIVSIFFAISGNLYKSSIVVIDERRILSCLT